MVENNNSNIKSRFPICPPNIRGVDPYRTVLEDLTEMIARHLPNGTITFVNRAYSQFLHLTREELIGTSCYSYISAPNARILRKNIASLSVDNPVVTNQQKVLTQDGEERWQQWINRAIFDHRGNMIEFQAVGRDITDLKNIERNLKKNEADLRIQKKILERKNLVLHEVLHHIEIDKKQFKDNIVNNVEKLILPTLQKIQNQLPQQQQKYIYLLEKNLTNLISSFGCKISSKNFNLTPREIEICDLIRNGFTSKEIADLLHISFYTIETHRTHIRKKLELNRKNINLTSYLNNIN